MKKLFISILFCLPLMVEAQNVWERPEVEQQKKQEEVAKPNPDAKYLEGAVPMANGKIEWSTDIKVPGKTAEQIYDRMMTFLTDMTKEENQTNLSQVALVNKQNHIIVAKYTEWLVFSSSFLALDQTKFNYTLIVKCSDNEVNVKLCRISYIYEENRSSGGTYKAEEWIDDGNALNKKKTKLSKITGKFRKKTIDRKDYIFKTIDKVLNSNV